MTHIEQLKNKADTENRRAIQILEDRGFKFLAHFGYENAAYRLNAMNKAMDIGLLPEHLKVEYGIS